jgi:hypothetical protein
MSYNLGEDMWMEAIVYIMVFFLYSDYSKLGYDITQFGKWLITF